MGRKNRLNVSELSLSAKRKKTSSTKNDALAQSERYSRRDLAAPSTYLGKHQFFRERRESNPRQLGEKRKRYLCAMAMRPPSIVLT